MHRLFLVGSEIVEDDDVARLQSRHEELIDIGAETLAVDGSVKQVYASMRSLRKAARNVAVFHLPCGNLVDEALSSAPSREALSCWSSSRSHR